MMNFFHPGFCPVDQRHHDEEYETLYWAPLRITIESFLRPQPNTGLSSFHETFSLIYKCVCDGRATKLYADLLDLCTSHLKSVHVDLMNSLTSDQGHCKQDKISDLIREFDQQLSIYLIASSSISSVFCYLVKFLEEKLNYGCPLENQLKKLFCEEVGEHYVYEILDTLENSSPNLEIDIIQRLLTNLEIVSQHKYTTRYYKVFSHYGVSLPVNIYQPNISEPFSGVKHPPEGIRPVEVGTDTSAEYIIGLNPAQKRRADERD